MSVQIVGVNINLHKYGRDVSGKIRKFQGHILNDKTSEYEDFSVT
jgi:hypothetical protein